MQPPFPSPVPTWHNDLYPAIDPSKDPQSHAGQTVVITGAVSPIIKQSAGNSKGKILKLCSREAVLDAAQPKLLQRLGPAILFS